MLHTRLKAIHINTITIHTTTMLCAKCAYEWEPKVDKPKACPRCKTRLDVIKKDE